MKIVNILKDAIDQVKYNWPIPINNTVKHPKHILYRIAMTFLCLKHMHFQIKKILLNN
jgi:hypothetical protein